MERLQENYRQFDYNRFIYQEAKPAPATAPEGAEAPKEKEQKAPAGQEKPEDIQERVRQFDEKTDKMAIDAGVDAAQIEDKQRAHQSQLETAKGKRDVVAKGMDAALDKVTTSWTKKVEAFINKKRTKPAESAPATEPAKPVEGEAKAGEKAPEKPLDADRQAVLDKIMSEVVSGGRMKQENVTEVEVRSIITEFVRGLKPERIKELKGIQTLDENSLKPDEKNQLESELNKLAESKAKEKGPELSGDKKKILDYIMKDMEKTKRADGYELYGNSGVIVPEETMIKIQTQYIDTLTNGDVTKVAKALDKNEPFKLPNGEVLDTIMQKELGEKYTEARDKTSTKSREDLTTILFTQGKFKELLAPEMGIDKGADITTFKAALNKNFGDKITTCLNDLQSPLVKGLQEEGDKYQVTAEDSKAILKVFIEGSEDVDKAEVALINGLKIGDGSGKQKTFAEVFGENYATILSRKYAITEGTGENIITINEKSYKDFPTLINETNPQIISTEVGNKYKALFDKTDAKDNEKMKPEDREAKIKELQETGTVEANTAARMAQIEKALMSPEGVAGLKGMKPMELIATIIQLWSVAKKAMESGDFNTLGDMMSDLSSGKNPMESMKAAENMYKQKIEGINEPNELMEMYTEPDGIKVTEKFGEGTKYKNMLKQAIEGKMESALNVDITKMEKEAEGGYRIFANKGGKNFEITVGQDNKMQVVKVETADNDKRITRLQGEIDGLGTTEEDKTKEKTLRRQIAELEANNGKEDREEQNVSDTPFLGLTGVNSMADRFKTVLSGEAGAKSEEPAPVVADAQPTTPPASSDAAGKVADSTPTKPKGKKVPKPKGDGYKRRDQNG